MEDDPLKSFKIFSSLSKKMRERILTKFDRINLNQGEVLFYQGDSSDCLYLLASGELSATLTLPSGETQLVNYIVAGETVGELGALSNEPRSLTIKASKNSTLFKLLAKDFILICQKYPRIMFETINPIIARSQKVISLLSSEKIKKQIVIVPANKEVSLDIFSEQLTKYISKLSSIIFISDYDPEISDLTLEALEERINKIEKNKKPKQIILYLLKSPRTSLAEVGLRKGEMLYVVGTSRVAPQFDRTILEIIKKYRSRHKLDPKLILLYPKSVLSPHKTTQWLKLSSFSLHHYIRSNNAADYQRLLRFFRGKAVGLVLGGGGTRGFAHLGAIKALRDAKIPIDIIGGTSVGAIVAGCYAINQNYADAEKRFSDIVTASRKSVSWRNLTWPIISIFNAKNFTLALQKIFNTTRIEDLWLPYFCISCNLANNTEAIHRSGYLWKKTRSSASIPGLIPPMLLKGELHFDGGLLNNLPVDVMRQLVGIKGKVIAIELANSYKDENIYKFPPVLTFWQTLLLKLKIGGTAYRFPAFLDTFLKALSVSSLLKARQNGLIANLLVSLDLTKFSMLHMDEAQSKQLVDIGYQETLKHISKLKASKLMPMPGMADITNHL